MTEHDRWEQGSEFHWPLEPFTEAMPSPRPWGEEPTLLGSGRDAFRALIKHGHEALAWARLWVPSYMCQHVIQTLVRTGITCVTYEDAPTEAGPKPESLRPDANDAVLLVNYFGLRDASVLAPLSLGDATLIVDHTHDPLSSWAFDDQADYALASLRKTLPTPDGGVLWSPRGLPLPTAPQLSEERALAAQAKWKAMRLKGHYLAGELVSKSDFRALAADGEASIASGPISGVYPETRVRLATMPLHAWRARRGANHARLVNALKGIVGVRALIGSEGSCPFSVFLVFDTTSLRDRVRRALIEARVYPAILWPMAPCILPGVPKTHQALGDTSLSVHCDMRYDKDDMERIADVIVNAVTS